MKECAIGFIAVKGDIHVIFEIRGPELTGYVASLRKTGEKRKEKSLGYDMKKMETFVKRSKAFYVERGFEVTEFVDLCS